MAILGTVSDEDSKLSNTLPTTSLMYRLEPPGLGPKRTTTMSLDGMIMVICPMKPDAQ